MTMINREKAEARLNHFEAGVRREAIDNLAALLNSRDFNEVTPPHINMHCHTFFSYNGYGASPSGVAWKAKTDGWHAAGICDFDVLDGMDEFLRAGDLLGLRASVNLETRVFFAEYADVEINSPGEPGVYYFMGAGFVRLPSSASSAGKQLKAMRQGAAARNREIVNRVNAHVAPLSVDYDADVLPLTPAGNATERHIVSAYYDASRKAFEDAAALAEFWSGKLNVTSEAAAKLMEDPMAFNDVARGKLMKAGGPGYIEPTPTTFPKLDDVITMIRACKAIPMATWLDGLSAGEKDIEAQLTLLMEKGVEAINIIPDRNYTGKPGPKRDTKVRKLFECVAVANKLHLPINIGTELNKYGQLWVDNFYSEPMRKLQSSFLRGAHIMVGQTRLLRYADFPYIGEEARAEFPDRQTRNDFFEAVGALPSPGKIDREKLATSGPGDNYSLLHDAATRGAWPNLSHEDELIEIHRRDQRPSSVSM